jgi:two-component system cell cycle sensor histidine kinase/response regulator CckA
VAKEGRSRTEGTKPGRSDRDGAPDREYLPRLLFEQMSSAVAIGDIILDEAGKPIDYRIVDVNPAFERLTGQAADYMVGKRASELNPGLRRELIERLGRVAVSGQTEEFEGRDPETDRFVLIRLSRIGPTWVMAMIEDITDARRAEAAIRERNAFVETIIASAGEGIIVYDRDLRLVVWNPVMEELTGLSSSQVLGGRAHDVFPEIMAAGVGEDLARALAGDGPTSREFEYVIPHTGRRGWVVQANRPHRGERGEAVGVVSSVRDITAQHELDEATRRSEEQLRAIFDSMVDGVSINRPDGKLIEVNRAVCERLGYTREELLAMNVAEINSPESAAGIAGRIEQFLQGGIHVFEVTHVRRDGVTIPIESSGRCIEFRDGPAILTVDRDIIERKRSDEALREHTHLIQQLLDAIPIPIVADYTDGRPRLANAAYVAGPGRLREGAGGRRFGEFDEADAAMHAAHDRPVLENGAVETYEADLYSPDGPVRRQLLTKAPLRAKDGTITGMVTAGVDISDRYRAEQDLRQSEERFRTLFDNAGDSLLIIDRDGRFLDANMTACRRLGYTPEELATMFAPDIDTPEFAAGFGDRMARLLERGILSFESAHVARDGTVIPTEITATTITLDGKLAILSIARDLTERRQADAERAALEDQLRQAQKMEEIGRLAGGIAHDFNNLLTAIRGSASLALAELPPGEGPREDLEQIEQAADRAAGLTRQLLAFARRTVLQPEVLDLGEVVRRVEPMLSRLLSEDIGLSIRAPAGTGRVLADPGQMEQVIVNLAVNARDAMPDGGTLTIEIADLETTAEMDPQQSDVPPLAKMTTLSVTDTGVGMDADTLGHLFEPFFTTKAPGKGTGLGLATVYGIVRQSGGTVTARSDPHNGSTFTVYLPRVETTIRSGKEPTGARATVGNRTGTILLVEDDNGVRRFASRVLEAAGFKVLTAHDGASALETARTAAVQLLLTDVVMPGMSGPEVAARLSAAQPELRILYMSGHTDKGIVRDGVLQAGVEFLAKPFTSESLVAAVDAAMADPQMDATDRGEVR